MGGGANPAGALGHIAAVLELAEQIRSGVVPDPDHIILPQGSFAFLQTMLSVHFGSLRRKWVHRVGSALGYGALWRAFIFTLLSAPSWQVLR
jgi:hypothetical protein